MKKFSMETRVGDVLMDTRAQVIVEEFIPGCLGNSQLPLIKKMKVKNLKGKGGYVGLSPEEEASLLERILALEEEA